MTDKTKLNIAIYTILVFSLLAVFFATKYIFAAEQERLECAALEKSIHTYSGDSEMVIWKGEDCRAYGINSKF